jgi:hypothetical protein
MTDVDLSEFRLDPCEHKAEVWHEPCRKGQLSATLADAVAWARSHACPERAG